MATRQDRQFGNMKGQKLRNVADPTEDLDGVNLRYFGEGDNFTNFDVNGHMLMNGEAVVWNDLQFSVSSGKVGAANIPAWSAFAGNLYEYSFAVNDYIDLGSQEIPHSYQEGTDIYFHVHWATNGATSGNRYVKWEIEYTIAGRESTIRGSQFPTPTVISAESIILSGSPALSHMYTMLPVVSGTNITIGSIIKCRLRRITSTGTAPAANPFALQVGIHFQSDMVGSSSISTK